MAMQKPAATPDDLVVPALRKAFKKLSETALPLGARRQGPAVALVDSRSAAGGQHKVDLSDLARRASWCTCSSLLESPLPCVHVLRCVLQPVDSSTLGDVRDVLFPTVQAAVAGRVWKEAVGARGLETPATAAIGRDDLAEFGDVLAPAWFKVHLRPGDEVVDEDEDEDDDGGGAGGAGSVTRLAPTGPPRRPDPRSRLASTGEAAARTAARLGASRPRGRPRAGGDDRGGSAQQRKRARTVTERGAALEKLTPGRRMALKQAAVDTHLSKDGRGRRCPHCCLVGHFLKTCPWADVDAPVAAREAGTLCEGVGV